MNIRKFKHAVRSVLLEVKKPRQCLELLEGEVVTENPFWGHCAQATEAGYVLGRVLYGSEFTTRFKAFKNEKKGHESHYWLGNPQEGKEDDVCDLTDHPSDPAFNYSRRRLSNYINRKSSRHDIKNPNVLKIYDLALKKLRAKA